jgi:hypothetical protein
MRSHLLDIQYAARRHATCAGISETSSQIIEADGDDAGWLLTTTLPHEVRLVEIMVVPERRGQASGPPPSNRAAIALYERLGFRRIDGDEVQYFMEYSPPS